MHLSAGTTELYIIFSIKEKSASLCSGANTAQLHQNRHRSERERERERELRQSHWEYRGHQWQITVALRHTPVYSFVVRRWDTASNSSYVVPSCW